MRLVGRGRQVVFVVDPFHADAEVRIGRQGGDVAIGVLVLPRQFFYPAGN